MLDEYHNVIKCAHARLPQNARIFFLILYEVDSNVNTSLETTATCAATDKKKVRQRRENA